MELVGIDTRFKTPEEWRAYVRGTPAERPGDLFVRFTVDGAVVELLLGRERGGRMSAPTSERYVNISS